METQFRIAAGATLADVGSRDQHAIGAPRGFAVQARVVATGAGTLAAYREPSGVGVRVDASGYVGYAPPPQFDPLLAKVIGSSNSSGTLTSALERTSRALAELHVAGLPTNIGQLRAILAHRAVRAGDARTTLLVEEAETLKEGVATTNDRMLACSSSTCVRAPTAPATRPSAPRLRRVSQSKAATSASNVRWRAR